MSTNQYRKDVEECDVFNRFMDTCVYPGISYALEEAVPKSVFEFCRCVDMGQQYDGCDVRFKVKNGKTQKGGFLCADEKAQLHNINDPIPSFCFELSYIKDGRVVPGWFVNPQKKTEAYILCWPRGVEDTESGNIYTGATIRIVFKKDVEDFVARHGYDREALIQKAREIRAAKRYGRHEATSAPHGFHFYFTGAKKNGKSSGLYEEQMINLILSERQLERLAQASLVIDFNPETNCMDIDGRFGLQPIHQAFPVPYNVYSISI